jgi:hypothetical protein
MTSKFSMNQILFNRNTKEKGMVGRVYELNGVTMYEVRVPLDCKGFSIGSNVSDWAENVLEPEQRSSRDEIRFLN